MTSDQDPQPTAPIFGDMTVDRAEEIESLLKNGRMAEVPTQELQEYQEFQKSLKAAMSPVIERYAEQMASSLKKSGAYQRAIDNIAKNISTPFRDDRFTRQLRIVPYVQGTTHYDSESGSDERKLDEPETLEVELSPGEQAQIETLAVMKAMAADLAESKEKLEKVSSELDGHKQSGITSGRIGTATIWIAAATLIATVLAIKVPIDITLPWIAPSEINHERPAGTSFAPYGYK